MRNSPLLALASLALLISCSEQESLTSALTPGRASFAASTATASAPTVLSGWNNSTYSIAYDINDLGTITGVSDAAIRAVGWATGTNPAAKSTTPFLIGAGEGRAINSFGQVAGSSGNNAALWTPSGGGYVLTDIGSGPLFVQAGATNSVAYGMNAAGHVVGNYFDGVVSRCFVWVPSSTNGTTGTATEVPGLGGNFCVANDINLAGQIVGAATDISGLTHGFVRSNSQTFTLGPAADGTYGTAINNAGQVAGSHQPASGPNTAAVWTPSGGLWSSVTDLAPGALSGQSGVIESAAMDINDAGYVVGYTRDPAITVRAFFWQGTAFTELPGTGAATIQPNALANVTNNRVIVAGTDVAGSVFRGLRWSVMVKR